MNYWKPIVASLVIFVSGLVSGVIITKSLVSAPEKESVVEAGPRPWENRWFIGRLERELKLTPEQREDIESLLEKSQEDIEKLFEPSVQRASEINIRLREDMRAVMTPEQVEEYDRLMSRPSGRRGGGPSRGNSSGGEGFRGGGDRGGSRGDFGGRGDRGDFSAPGNRGDFGGRGDRGGFGSRDGGRPDTRFSRGNQPSTNAVDELTESNDAPVEKTSEVPEESEAVTN